MPRQAAPARRQRETRGNMKSKAAVVDAAHHISAATLPPAPPAEPSMRTGSASASASRASARTGPPAVAQPIKSGASTTRTDHEFPSRRSGGLISSRFAANGAVQYPDGAQDPPAPQYTQTLGKPHSGAPRRELLPAGWQAIQGTHRGYHADPLACHRLDSVARQNRSRRRRV